MHINRLLLQNYGNHESLDVTFSDGCTAIIGPNGAGKSHVIGAIRLALTGVNSNSGVKADNIRTQAPVGAASFVQLWFTHAGTVWNLRRNLRPLKPTARLENEHGCVEGDEAVTNKLQQILGVSVRVLNDIVIVAQSEILGFIDMTATQRAELFQKLFATDQAAKITKFLGERIKGLTIPTPTADRDQTVQAITECGHNVVALSSQLQQWRSTAALQQLRDDLLLAIDRRQEVQRATQEHEQVGAMIAACDRVIDNTQKALEQARGQNDEALAEHHAATEIAKQAEAALQALATAQLQYHQWQQGEVAIADAQRQLAELEALPPIINQYGLRDIHAQLGALRSEAAVIERRLQQFSAGVVACPTCGTAVANLPFKPEDDRLKLDQLQQRQQQLQSHQRQSDEIDLLISQRQQALVSARTRLQTLQTYRKPQPVIPVIDEAAAARSIDRVKQLHTAAVNATTAVQKLAITLTAEQAKRDQAARQLRTVAQRMTQTVALATEEQLQAAKVDVTTIEQEMQQRTAAETSLSGWQQRGFALTQQLTGIDEAIRQGQLVQGWLAVVDRVQGVLAKDAAPQLVAKQNLALLQGGMNEVLQMFDSGFTVETTDGLAFYATFADATRQPVERLSGGQKVVLALAFRLSLNLLVASQVGALYLDEPTAWLDEQRIRSFETVLHRLRELSNTRGIQFILVTHEQGLGPLFDQVVRIC